MSTEMKEGVLTYAKLYEEMEIYCRGMYPAPNPKGLPSIEAHGVLMFIPNIPEVIPGVPAAVLTDETVARLVGFVKQNFTGKIGAGEGFRRLYQDGELARLLHDPA